MPKKRTRTRMRILLLPVYRDFNGLCGDPNKTKLPVLVGGLATVPLLTNLVPV
jgi:hypothetical protein